jgi:putative hydrolase of the HAD superfamily
VARFDAVLFDLDGTLCRRVQDTEAMYAAVFDRTGVEPFGDPAALWAALDGPPDPADQVSYLGAGFARLAAQYGRTEIDPLVLAEHLVAAIDNTQVELLPGAEDALERAAATGQIGLLTNGPADRQAIKVEALGLEDRFDDQFYSHLDDPILDRRNPQRTGSPALLWDLHSFDGTGLVLLVDQFVAQFSEPIFDAFLFDGLEGHTVDTRGAAVLADPFPRMPQRLFPTDLVVEGIEAKLGLLFRLAIKLPLQLPKSWGSC